MEQIDLIRLYFLNLGLARCPMNYIDLAEVGIKIGKRRISKMQVWNLALFPTTKVF